MQPRELTRGQQGSGTVLAIGVVAFVTALTLALVPLGAGLLAKSSSALAADASALAAADVAIGLSPGFPCQAAAEIASANGATLVDCRADGVIVTVRVEVRFGEFRISSVATAGPPGSPGPSG